MTTGISAPPIGITTKKPNKIEITTIIQKIEDDCVKTKTTINANINKNIRALIKC